MKVCEKVELGKEGQTVVEIEEEMHPIAAAAAKLKGASLYN